MYSQQYSYSARPKGSPDHSYLIYFTVKAFAMYLLCPAYNDTLISYFQNITELTE